MSKKSSGKAGTSAGKKNARTEKKTGQAMPEMLASVQQPDSPATTADEPANDAAADTPQQEIKTMTLTLKGIDKRGRNAIYTGAAVSLRLAISAFPNKTAPATFSIPEGVFDGPRPKADRKRLTKEERAALPKPTAAELLKKAEDRVAKLREKVAKGSTELQPAL